MITGLSRIAEKAKADPKARFTSLAHLLTPEFLLETYKQMNRRGAAGVDGETIQEFESDLGARIEDLHMRLRAGRYRPPPVRRVEIPKGNGKTRPLGIPTVEDRLVQRAVARILGAIYEQDFMGLFVWISARAQPAPSAARAAKPHCGGQGTGRIRSRYPRVFQPHQPRVAAQNGGPPHRRPGDSPPDRAVAPGRGDAGGASSFARRKGLRREARSARCSRTSTCTMCLTSGSPRGSRSHVRVRRT